MKPERSILTAFLLNLAFSVLECVGGLLTGSVAILSDAVHDLGDAAGIGLSYLLERKSHRPPDKACTYGYARYSVLGGVLTSVILLLGSAAVICHAAGLHKIVVLLRCSTLAHHPFDYRYAHLYRWARRHHTAVHIHKIFAFCSLHT